MKITDKEAIAAKGKYIHKIGDSAYFTRCTLLDGDTIASFEEVDSLPDNELENAKETKIAEIITYDQSNSVNGFVYNGETLWLKKEERLAVKDRFEREMARGVKITTLYADGKPFPISPAEGIALLDAISEYADKCFDQTEMHKAAVKSLTTVEEVEVYDYTVGYPSKLSL